MVWTEQKFTAIWDLSDRISFLRYFPIRSPENIQNRLGIDISDDSQKGEQKFDLQEVERHSCNEDGFKFFVSSFSSPYREKETEQIHEIS